MPQVKLYLLLSNCCHVEYFTLTLSHWLNSWLTKSWVLFVVHEDNLRSGLTSVGWAHTISRSLGQAMATITRFSTNITDTIIAPARAPFSSYTCAWWSASARLGAQVSHTLTIYQCCYKLPLFVVMLNSCLYRRLCSTIYSSAFSWVDYTRRDLSMSVHNLVPKTMY